MDKLIELIGATVQSLLDVSVEPQLTTPDEQFGDAATNVALQLAQTLHKKPRDIAEQLAAELETKLPTGSKLSVEGPGFINFHFADGYWLEVVEQIREQQEAYGKSEHYRGQSIVAEYSDPNAFKELHAGHLYTSLVGDSIARILESAGADVHRINFGGDVGLHVGKSMWAILKTLKGGPMEKLEAIEPSERAAWLSARYVQGTTAYEEDEAAHDEIIELNKRVYQLHEKDDHDTTFAQIYWTCRKWSYDGFEQLYKQLDMAPFEKYYPESETVKWGIEAVQQGLEKGVFARSDGAVVYKGEDDGLHTRVFLNSAGLPTYEAKDLGLNLHLWQDYHFDRRIVITAGEQAEYMKVVFAAVRQIQPEAVKNAKHLTHGLIKLAGGQKMSSRKGNVLRAADVLDAAEQAAASLGEASDAHVSLAAVRYAFLKVRIGGDIIYDPAESVSLQGNSGPYLQYAHARARSILKKKSGDATHAVTELESGEKSLVRKLSLFPEIVARATTDLLPHHICTYLYELAQTFNHFYEHNRVIDHEREGLRLELVAAYATVLKNGLGLLGIIAPEQM